MESGTNTVDGVEITQQMVELYAKRFNIELTAANVPGIVGTIGGWIKGIGTPDSTLTDSVEGRELFAGVRTAYFAKLGQPEPAFSNVQFETLPSVPTGTDSVEATPSDLPSTPVTQE